MTLLTQGKEDNESLERIGLFLFVGFVYGQVVSRIMETTLGNVYLTMAFIVSFALYILYRINKEILRNQQRLTSIYLLVGCAGGFMIYFIFQAKSL